MLVADEVHLQHEICEIKVVNCTDALEMSQVIHVYYLFINKAQAVGKKNNSIKCSFGERSGKFCHI